MIEAVPVSAASDAPGDDTEGVRVRVHPGLCEGWGNCHRFAPDVYPLDEEGHIGIHLLDVPAEQAPQARLGAIACPEHAISVIGPPGPARPTPPQRRGAGTPGSDAG